MFIRLFIVLIFSLFNTMAVAGLNISGFGSVGGAVSDSKIPYELAVSSDIVNWEQHSLVGLNFSKSLSSDIEVITQFIAIPNKTDFNPDYDLSAELLIISWRPNSNWQIRIGKLRAPLWFVSDYKAAHLLQPWIRPPQQVYSILPVSSFSGLSVMYTQTFNDWDFSLEPFTGVSEINLPSESHTSIQPIVGSSEIVRATTKGVSKGSFGLSAIVTNGKSKVKLGVGKTLVVADLEVVIKTPALATVVTPVLDNTVPFYSAGYSFEGEKFMLMSEFAMINPEGPSTIDYTKGYYLTLGYWRDDRKLLTHFTYSESDFKNAGFESIIEKKYSMGTNYHFSSNLIGKLEVAMVDPGDGILSNSFRTHPGRDVTVASFALDFMF